MMGRWRSLALVGVFAALLPPYRAGASDGPSSGEPVIYSSPDVRIEKLIADLGGERWATREAASAELIKYGSALYDTLLQAYLKSEHYETRDRIKRIVLEIHLNETVGPVRAYLGISHAPFDAAFASDSVLVPGGSGLELSTVVPGSAAGLAGLQPGDVLIGLNGERATTEKPAMAFVKWIGEQLPGTPCRITVIMGSEGRILSLENPIGFDPRGFKRAERRLVTWEEDRRLPEGAYGIELTNVERADKRLDLQNGDLIISLNGKRLEAETALSLFEIWTQWEPQFDFGRDNEQEGRRGQQGFFPNRRVIQKELVPAIQIVRGGKVVDLDIVLTARPSNLRDGRAWQRGMQDRRREFADAEAGFERLWADIFKRDGISSDRADAGALWRLETK